MISGNRILLGQRAAHKRVAPCLWDIVGGHVEPGETIAAALIREVEEELGVTPSVFRRLASLHERASGSANHDRAVHHIYAVTSWNGGTPRNVSAEHTEIRWFTRAELRCLANKTAFDFEELCTRAGLSGIS